MSKPARPRPRPGRPPRDRGEAMVRRVLDLTLQQLAQVGLERLSVPEIADLAGVNKTSIFRRWPTKVELVRAALAHSMGHVRDIPDTGSLRTDLITLAGVVADFITSPRGMGVVRTAFADRDTPEMRALAASMWQEAGGDVPRLVIERAMRRGELPEGADIELLLFTLAGAVLHRVFVEHAQADAGFAGRLVDLLLHGAVRR
ncbi:MAG TPA: TetR/AcrR family transcriptional regulator [Candidatus Nanopelagicales bacterium]|nr:TetR/AcrR family transcriptional regulator [Candidatus Nanopelagicales bacterium]